MQPLSLRVRETEREGGGERERHTERERQREREGEEEKEGGRERVTVLLYDMESSICTLVGIYTYIRTYVEWCYIYTHEVTLVHVV